MLRSDGLHVLRLFSLFPAAPSWIMEKNRTNRRTGVQLTVSPAHRDPQTGRCGWQAWGAGCAEWGGPSASPGEEGGEAVLQMLKGKMVFHGKSGGGKGAEDCLCAPREGEQLSAAAPGTKRHICGGIASKAGACIPEFPGHSSQLGNETGSEGARR